MNGRRLRLFWLAPGGVVTLATLAASPASAPVDTPHALVSISKQDPARMDRARDLLEAAISRDEAANTHTLVTLSRPWFLYRRESRGDRGGGLAATYDRGRVVAERAIARAPGDAEAHLWCAINLGSWANVKGLFRSVLTLQTIRREVDTVLRLDPDNVDGHVMAGSLARNSRYPGRRQGKVGAAFQDREEAGPAPDQRPDGAGQALYQDRSACRSAPGAAGRVPTRPPPPIAPAGS